jgi:hypothetical protein
MTTDTQKLILRLKRYDGSYLHAVIQHLKDERKVDPKYITLDNIDQILREAITDYLSTCDDILSEMRFFFGACMHDVSLFDKTQIDLYCRFLANVKVRKLSSKGDGRYTYINGFDEEIVLDMEERL